ncbi:MAG: hypothetical protein Q9160_007378 [Pyrenula sp. 1 TL-2023]
MRFFATVATATALLGVAAANGRDMTPKGGDKGAEKPANNSTAPPSYTTLTVTSLETYCPYATEYVNNGKTYTVTEATTLTITDCPCTKTMPVTTSTQAGGSQPPAPPAPTPTPTTVIPVPIPSGGAPGSPASPPAPGNGTGPYVPPTTPQPSAGSPGSPTGTSPPISSFTGAAGALNAGSGLGLAGFVAAAAYFL